MAISNGPRSNLVQPEEQKEHKRRVSFNSMAEVCYLETSSLSSNSDDEEEVDNSELWWTAHDYKKIKGRCRYEARRRKQSLGERMFSEGLDDSRSDCRGLERMMDGGKCRMLTTEAIRAVQREQTRQRLDGVDEDSDLHFAQVYGVYSSNSAIRAERLGRLDAREALQALRSDWTLSCPSLAASELAQSQAKKENALESSSAKSKTTSSKTALDSRSSADMERNALRGILTNMMTRRRRACRAWI